MAQSSQRRKRVAVKPPEPPDKLALHWGVQFQRVVKKHLTTLVSTFLDSPWVREDAVSAPLRGLLDRLIVHFMDLVSEDLVVLMQGLLDQTALFNLEQFGTVWRSLVGIPYSPTPGMELFIKGLQKENAGLIKSLTKTLADRVRDTVEKNLGESNKTLVTALQEEVGIGSRKAKLFARDQVLKLNGQLTEARHTEAGITEYEWVTSGDERVRSAHRALDGKRFTWDKPPVVDRKTGRRAHPGGDYQCRCTANPVVD